MSLIRVVSSSIRLVIAAAFGYLAGSILMADLAAKAAKRTRRDEVDIRAVGSGNPGAANVMANLGTKWGLTVLAGDIAKGALAGAGGRRIGGPAGGYLAATAAVAGHCFPIWSSFRGGKGVATSAGTTLTVFPAYVPIDFGVVGVSYLASKHAGKATMAASTLFVVAAISWYRRGWSNFWGPKPTLGLPLYAITTSLMIAYRFAAAPPHRGDMTKGTGTPPPDETTNA